MELSSSMTWEIAQMESEAMIVDGKSGE